MDGRSVSEWRGAGAVYTSIILPEAPGRRRELQPLTTQRDRVMDDSHIASRCVTV